MRDRADHYTEADRLLEEHDRFESSTDWMLMAAIGHALLASAPADVAAKVFVADKAQQIREIVDGR